MSIQNSDLKPLVEIIERISTLSTFLTKEAEDHVYSRLSKTLPPILQSIDILSDQISYDNGSSGLSSDNVKDAIDELAGLIDILENDISNLSASDISTTSPLSSSNVQQELESLNSKINSLQSSRVRVNWFDTINSQNGQISNIPLGAQIELGKFSGLDALVSELNPSNQPDGESPEDSGGNIISVSSLDASGNYALDLTPQGNIAIIYSYSTSLLDFNHSESLGYFHLDPTADEIEQKYESQPNTNKYNNTDKSKVDLISVSNSIDLDQVQADLSNKEDAFSKNTAFNKDFGSLPGTVVEGDDSRLSDERTPLDNSANNSKLADMPANTLKGKRNTPGNPEDLTVEQVLTLLDLNNVDNTSDLDKPISNDTQEALDNKANSSITIEGSDGLEGGGDLTDNRTLSLSNVIAGGTSSGVDSAMEIEYDDKGRLTSVFRNLIQISAAQVTQFALAVRGVLMSGLNLSNSSDIVSTDNLITAVGKLQAQLNLRKPVYLSSNGLTTVTGAIISDKINTTVNFLTTGTYHFTVNYLWNLDTTTNDFYCQMLMNGAFFGSTPNSNGDVFIHREEAKDSADGETTLIPGTGSNQYLNYSKTFSRVITSTGPQTLILRFGTPAAGVSASMWNLFIKIEKEI